MRLLEYVLAASSILATAFSQFVPPPDDLTTAKGFLDLPVRYKQVPDGICELTPGIKSYSGYVDIAPEQHIFFWFFEARKQDPSTAPLTVWISGGPGTSSMYGLFAELGPCGVDHNGALYGNPHSWNGASNLLVIDQPTQTGFSYSVPVPGFVSASNNIVQLPNTLCPDYAQALGTCGTYPSPDLKDTANSTLAAAPTMWLTLQGFLGAFPQYSRDGFNFASESYGGHWGPVFGTYLEEQNVLIKNGKLPGAHEIKLKTLLIGNGWYDPLIQFGSYYNFSVSPGNTYDIDAFNDSVKALMYNSMYGPGNCHDMISDCYTRGTNDICSAADSFCQKEVESALSNYAGRDEYDFRQMYPNPFPYLFFADYLNTAKVQQALGAYVKFSTFSDPVLYAFTNTGDDGREAGTIADVKKLVEQGVYVVQYYGDADYICNWLGGEAVAQEIGAAGFDSAGYADIVTSDGVVNGQVKQSANFAFVRVYYSGHEVPFYQPLLALEMFERAIAGKDIRSGKEDVGLGSSYKTVGTGKSTFREGDDTVQYNVLPPDATYNTTTHAPNAKTGKKLKRNGRLGSKTPSKPPPKMRKRRLVRRHGHRA